MQTVPGLPVGLGRGGSLPLPGANPFTRVFRCGYAISRFRRFAPTMPIWSSPQKARSTARAPGERCRVKSPAAPGIWAFRPLPSPEQSDTASIRHSKTGIDAFASIIKRPCTLEIGHGKRSKAAATGGRRTPMRMILVGTRLRGPIQIDGSPHWLQMDCPLIRPKRGQYR